MQLTIAAVGRLRPADPEHALVDDWLERAGATGRSLGFGPASVLEVDERRFASRDAQAKRLAGLIPADSFRVALDERGKLVSSRELAGMLAQRRDQGCPRMVFLIGGADGLSREIRANSDYQLSLGPMVWPHKLARAMLAEQIYRATTILAGLPYHRD